MVQLNFSSATQPDDPTTRNQILAIVETFKCMAQYTDMKTFFSNAANISGIKDAVAQYGIPAKNSPIRHGVFGIKTHTPCDWNKGMLRLYVYAYYMVQIDAMNYSTCDGLAAIQTYITNTKADITGGALTQDEKNTRLDALNDIATEVNTAFSSMLCGTVITNEQNATALADQQQAATAAAALSTTPNTTKYFIYGVAGIIVILGLKMFLKKKGGATPPPTT